MDGCSCNSKPLDGTLSVGGLSAFFSVARGAKCQLLSPVCVPRASSGIGMWARVTCFLTSMLFLVLLQLL